METDALPDQTIERRSLDLVIAQRTDGVRPLIIGNDPQDVRGSGLLSSHRLHGGEDQQDHQKPLDIPHEHFSCRPLRHSSKSAPMKESIIGIR